MAPDPLLPALLADLVAVVEYASDLGFQDLLPRPASSEKAAPRPAQRPPARQPAWEARPPSRPGPAPPQQPRPHLAPRPPAWAPSSGGASRRPSPSAILGQGPPKDDYPLYEDARSGPPAGQRSWPPRHKSMDTSWIERAASLDELAAGLQGCQNCSLSNNRGPFVPGRGPAGAPVLFVMDQPTPEEAEAGRIPIGQELALFLDIVSKGLKMDTGLVYATPLAKCPRPYPDYQDAWPLRACCHVAHKEIELVRPKAVVAMGPKVPGVVCGLEGLTFDSLRAKKLFLGPSRIPLVATFDLEAILGSLDIKRAFWQDLKRAMAYL